MNDIWKHTLVFIEPPNMALLNVFSNIEELDRLH